MIGPGCRRVPAGTCTGQQHRPALRRRLTLVTSLVLSLSLGGWMTGCRGEFHLSANSLIVSPNPARAGDLVTATFLLTLLPAQRHTIVVVINDTEWTRVVENGPPSVPTVVQVGAASDLLDRYGPGDHQMYITVDAHANDGRGRTEIVQFTLADPAAP